MQSQQNRIKLVIRPGVDQTSGPRTYARKSTDKYTNTWSKGISNAHSLFRQIANDIKFDPNMLVDTKLFSVGMTFDNVEDFLTPWQAYCSQILTNWRIYNAQTNETHGPRSPDGRVTVYRFTLECVHAGRPRKKQVWPLNQFFCMLFVKTTTLCQGNAILFRSSRQLLDSLGAF